MDLDLGWHTRAQKLAVVAYWLEQQRGVCCLCEDPDLLMDPYGSAFDHNPLSATIEHLIPKRDGGPNTARNVRMAHKMCNQALGSLWTVNQQRALAGAEPVSADDFLAAARAQYASYIAARRNGAPATFRPVHASRMMISLSTRPAPPGWVPSSTKAEKAVGAIPMSLARAIAAGRPIGIERGATLPGYLPPADPVVLARAKPLRPKDLLERKAEKVRRPVCSACGSADVTRDASLRWDIRNGGWVIAEHRDGYDCRVCEADTVPRWEFVNRDSA